MKNYLVIGGSKGVGKEVVQQISNNGDKCVVFSRSKVEFPYTGDHYKLDIFTDKLPDIESLDGLVYCIGSINLKPFNRLTLEDFNNDLQINLIGAVKIIQYYLPVLKKSETASIILFSSVATQLGMPFHASIAAAKSAVEGFVKSIAAELAPKIRVNCIAPSIIDTTLAMGILRNETIRENIINKHPLKRILNPIDVANTTLFLLSDKSTGITGQIIKQDNGLISLSY